MPRLSPIPRKMLGQVLAPSGGQRQGSRATAHGFCPSHSSLTGCVTLGKSLDFSEPHTFISEMERMIASSDHHSGPHGDMQAMLIV